MERTGLGNEKVLRIKQWATRSGFIEGKTLSPAGKLIWERDPYLTSPLTDWFMHFHLSLGDNGLNPQPDTPADWGGWTWFVYDYARSHPHFTQDELVQYSSTLFDDTPKLLTKNFKILLRAYTEPTALSSIQYLIPEGDTYHTGNANLPVPHLIGYFLAQLWQRDFPADTSILTQTLFDQPLSLAAILGISNDQLQTCLNTLETYAIIEQRREVPPFQLIRRWQDPLDLLDKAYA